MFVTVNSVYSLCASHVPTLTSRVSTTSTRPEPTIPARTKTLELSQGGELQIQSSSTPLTPRSSPPSRSLTDLPRQRARSNWRGTPSLRCHRDLARNPQTSLIRDGLVC